jgi:hypothetical protein
MSTSLALGTSSTTFIYIIIIATLRVFTSRSKNRGI